jgi:hypothetical protein
MIFGCQAQGKVFHRRTELPSFQDRTNNENILNRRIKWPGRFFTNEPMLRLKP